MVGKAVAVLFPWRMSASPMRAVWRVGKGAYRILPCLREAPTQCPWPVGTWRPSRLQVLAADEDSPDVDQGPHSRGLGVRRLLPYRSPSGALYGPGFGLG